MAREGIDGLTVISGLDIKDPGHTGRRDCYKDLEEFMEDNTQDGRICALYGLRRTGKTDMIRQYIAAMPEDEKTQTTYILCAEGADMLDLRTCMNALRKEEVKNFFIDEVTWLDDFQQRANILSDIFAKDGCKVVIAGTDSLGIRLAAKDKLLDRVKMVHTSHVPFAEFSRLKGGKSLDEYISYGGLLSMESYGSEKERAKYLDSSIVDNIQNSLINETDGHKYYMNLATRFSRQELSSMINKLINKFSYDVMLKTLNKRFRSAPFSTTLYTDEIFAKYDGKIKENEVHSLVKEAMGILDAPEMNRNFTGEDLENLYGYLEDLGLMERIPVSQSLKGGPESELKVLLQPGMVYCHAKYLTNVLLKDKVWEDFCPGEDRDMFIGRTDEYVRGQLMESILLSETYLALEKDRPDGRFYVSQLTLKKGQERPKWDGPESEIDILVVDLDKNESYLFEVKHSEKQVEKQSRHIRNKEFAAYIGEHFAPIARSAVIYRRENGTLDFPDGTKIEYLNAEQFLGTIHDLCQVPEMEIDPAALFDEKGSRQRAISELENGIYVDSDRNTGNDFILFGAQNSPWEKTAEIIRQAETGKYPRIDVWGMIAVKCSSLEPQQVTAMLRNGKVNGNMHTVARWLFLDSVREYKEKPYAKVPDFMQYVIPESPLAAYRKDMSIKRNYMDAEKSVKEHKALDIVDALAAQFEDERKYFDDHAGKYLPESDRKPIEGKADKAVERLSYCIEKGIHFSVTEDGIIPEERPHAGSSTDYAGDDTENPGDGR